jgi:lipopolysaccharide export system permease protein
MYRHVLDDLILLLICQYLGKRTLLLFTTLFVAMMLIANLIEVFSELHRLGQGNYNLITLMKYVILLAPRNTYTVFSFITSMAGLLTLYHLKNTAELEAIYTLGISKRKLLLEIIKPLLIMILLMTFVAESCSPYATLLAKNLRAKAITGHTVWSDHETTWWQEQSHLNKATFSRKNNSLSHVYSYQLNPQGVVTQIIQAPKGEYISPNWILNNPTDITFRNNQIIIKHPAKFRLPLNIPPHTLKLNFIDLNQHSLWALFKMYQTKLTNHEQITLELGRRITYPIYTLLITVIALLCGLLLPMRAHPIKMLLNCLLIGLACYVSDLLSSILTTLVGGHVLLCTLATLSLLIITTLQLLRKNGIITYV